MEIYLAYTKKRAEFGRQCALDDMPATVLDVVASKYVYSALLRASALTLHMFGTIHITVLNMAKTIF